MKRRRQRGVSLIEVLTAISLFALVAGAVGTLASGSMLRTTENRHATGAALLASQELERLRGLDYVDIVSGSSTMTMGGQYFTVDVAVQADTPAAGMKHITVTVDWNGPEGARTYEVETTFTDITA